MDRMAHGTLSRRRFLGGSLAAGALAALSACTSGGQTEQGSAAVAEQPLTIGFSRPASIDPALATDTSSLTVVWQLFDCLTSYDFSTGELSCLAAERYEVSDDAQTFTFYLRDAAFHDGSQVASEDFKRAWERIVSPSSAPSQVAGATPYAYLLSLIDGYDALHIGSATEFSGVTCPDSATLCIRLSTPYADLPYLLAHPVLGPVPSSADDDLPSFSQRPIGNGPFMMADTWKSGSGTLSLSRYDDYYGEVASLDRVLFDVEPDAESSFRSFQTGDIDVSTCPIGDASDAASSLGRSEDGRTLGDDGRFVCVTGLTTSMLACNCSAAPLDDPAVRRAISLAIDRDYLCDTLYRETRVPAHGAVPPTVFGYREESWAYAAFDPSSAAELLESSYPLNDDDDRGIEVRLSYNTDGGHAEVMQKISDDLADLGITCRLEALDAETLRQRIEDGDFDLVRVDWTADAPTLDSVLFPLFFSGCIGSTNYARYQNAHVDQQLAQARTELDEGTRVSLLQGADSIIGSECPVVPLMYHARSYAASERVTHLAIDTQGRLDLASAELAE